MTWKSEHLPRWLLPVLCAVYLAAGIGLRDPWPPDEPRYALVASEMVDGGHWLLPTRGGELYPDKPPVFFWAEALTYAATGSLHAAFLVPSLLAGLGTLWLVYGCGRALWDHRTGLIAAMLVLLTFQFLKQTTFGQIDALLCFFTTLGATGYLRHYLRGPAPAWLCIAAAACGLGVMTKGVGFLPVLLVPAAMAYRRWGTAATTIAPPVPARWRLAAIACFLLPIAAWLVPLLWLAHGNPDIAAYRDNLLFRQTVDRYAEPWGHFNPPWYYVARVIPLNWLALSPLLLFAVPTWWRRARAEPRFWLPLVWVVAVVLFFSATPAKRDIYVYPALPLAALAVAPLFDELQRRRALQWLYYLLCAGVTLALFAGWLISLGMLRVPLPADLAPGPFAPMFAWLVVVALLSGTWLRRRRAYYWFGILLVALSLAYRILAAPLLNDLRSSRGLAAATAAEIGPGRELGLLDWREQTLLQVRLNRVLGEPALFGFADPSAAARGRALTWLRERPDRWLLFPADAEPPCLNAGRTVDLGRYHRERWLLAGTAAVEPGCRAATSGEKP